MIHRFRRWHGWKPEATHMKPTHPLDALFGICVFAAVILLLAGLVTSAMVLALAALSSFGCGLSRQTAVSIPPRPQITYLPRPVPHEPLIRLQRGQFVTLPWPHTLQVLLPEGTHLKILEATSDHVRVMAV